MSSEYNEVPMQSIVPRLSDQEERLAVKWQTVGFRDTPSAVHRLARVVHDIEYDFPPNDFDHWVGDGSVSFRHKKISEVVVSVWVDDDNELSDFLFKTLMPPEPIVVGLDITAHSPCNRQVIREFLRTRFKFYCDPEKAVRPICADTAKKVCLTSDPDHWLDVVFFPSIPWDAPIDHARLLAIEHAIDKGAPTWCSPAVNTQQVATARFLS